jgi:hypothetical protein
MCVIFLYPGEMPMTDEQWAEKFNAECQSKNKTIRGL